ncbi:MAG: hypothetical protein CMI54_02090 [Parcubacteria group bacterium]|jgi:hypothetical protein|nr:hypothetical protein [Parcubacteria group bacterium]|tara:strand:+ start:4694 stop:7132 length:2439 start_codon:yes stop_codon:yes gene_type:complete
MSDNSTYIEDKNIQWQVWTVADWGGTWIEQTSLFPQTVNFELAPNTNTAQVFVHRGLTKRLDGNPAFVQTAPDIVGHWIRIRLFQADGAGGFTNKNWYGLVSAPADDIEGSYTDSELGEIAQGRTTFNCYGLEWLMQKTKMSIVFMEPSETKLKRVVPFNYSNSSRNNVLKGNRSLSRSGGPHDIFEFSADNEIWSALDVLEHLIAAFNDEALSGSALTLVLDYTVAALDLDSVENTWSFENSSYYDAINQICNPAYGFTWEIRTTYQDPNHVIELKVHSIVDVDITEDSNTIINANPDLLNIDVATDGAISGCNIKNLENNHFSKIVVRGERLRCCFTMKLGEQADELNTDWDNQTEYEAATDKERTFEEYNPVFQRFILNGAWDGTINGIISIPQIDPDTGKPTGISPATLAVQKIFPEAMQFDRNLPIQGLTGTDEKAQRRPFIIYSESGTYYRADKTGDDAFTDSGLKVLDDAAGIQFDQKVNHLNALNDFSGSSENSPQWDYLNGYVTVSMYTDERVRVELTALDASPFEMERIKYIDAPGLHCWYVAKDTIKTFTDSGLTKYSDAELVRDDTEKIRRLAYLANAWYGRKRSTIDLDYQDPGIFDVLGKIIETADTGGAVEPIGTIISSVKYTFNERSQKVEVGTSFKEFSFDKVLGLNKSFESLNTSGQASMDELQNINVRSAPGGGGGGGGYDGPWQVSYNSVSGEFEIGVNRSASAPDYIVANDILHNYTTKDTVTASTGYIIYKVSVNTSDVFTTTVSIQATDQPSQGNANEIQFVIAQVHISGTIIRQIQFGHVFVWARTGA